MQVSGTLRLPEIRGKSELNIFPVFSETFPYVILVIMGFLILRNVNSLCIEELSKDKITKVIEIIPFLAYQYF